ncbi:hypothetical protein PHLGIDRAFT_157348 [Phlebiopsis gigantea 11061_1 CR5-6]|uniref:Uncharacterized protein n=1 Tax=Phlebiopsis gigantea (strain 11061_1 CR5-6) TaxID=745531 RepID=A0A0C3PU31_PHLG1|nr:hypothetical protein PHLGIDRAFT_157348 [Phlebiopsis gigantea 11061_1 CR5-6]
MLARISYRAAASPLASRTGFLVASRHSSTAAAPEQPQQAGVPTRKSRIPLAQAYGDLAIPDRDSATQIARTRSSTVGTHRLSQDQFAGRGDLAARLLKKRAAQVSRERPQRTDTRKPKTPATQDAKSHAPKKAQASADKSVKEAREKAKRAWRGEPTVMKALPNKTDLTTLFNVPTPATPHKLTRRIRPVADLFVLERTGGDYSRYLSPYLARRPKESTLKAVGPADYARLALARVPQVSPKQRLKAVNIISSVIGITGPAGGPKVRAP